MLVMLDEHELAMSHFGRRARGHAFDLRTEDANEDDVRMTSISDNSAVRVALWRALHVLEDAPPHVFEDPLGLALVAPDEGWRKRPNMSQFTRPFRASIVARARFVEDLVEAQLACGVAQYVVLGTGLDTRCACERHPVA